MASTTARPEGATVRGADTLVQVLQGSAAARIGSAPAAKARSASSDRKDRKKLGRLLREFHEAMQLQRYADAEKVLDDAIALFDNPPLKYWIHRLAAASKASNYEYVADNYLRIRAMASSDDELAVIDRAWIDCLIAVGSFREALQVSAAWAHRKTSSWAAINSVAGVIHAELGDFDRSIAIQKSILAKEPGNAFARWHLALHQLQAGDLPAAFDNYEARWELSAFPSERRTFDLPRWSGEPVEGKRVLVWREQGIGDEIRFASLLPDLLEAGARVTVECHPKLLALFKASFPGIDVRPVKPLARRKSEDYVDFDFEVPIGSLARFFRPTVAQLQAKCAPWLYRDAKIEGAVRAAMNATERQPVIGLCWRSSNRNLKRNKNYLTPEHLAALRLLGRSGFICLQYDECSAETSLLRELGLPITTFASIDQMNDILGASRLTGACDLVVSAGTATAELSAGLGVPTIIFGQKRTQIQLGTDGVPWHPATRCLALDPDDPMAVVRSILFNWPELAAWADRNSVSGRQIDWRLSFPASG